MPAKKIGDFRPVGDDRGGHAVLAPSERQTHPAELRRIKTQLDHPSPATGQGDRQLIADGARQRRSGPGGERCRENRRRDAPSP
ncbi:MAG: hypothetical protein VX463_07175, partial [Pseudomonadota bacterium]|nr:hypothetical protein [Pseudomonadota bacterium]